MMLVIWSAMTSEGDDARSLNDILNQRSPVIVDLGTYSDVEKRKKGEVS